MKNQRIYLDTSVFMAEFNKKDPRHTLLTNFFKHLKGLNNTDLCSSKWALTELYNRLTKDQIEELKIVKYIKDLLDKNTIRSFKLKFLDVSPTKGYDFNHFFNHLTGDLIKFKTGPNRPGLGDILHIRIMKNNRINTIVTFDADFEVIEGFTTINLYKTKIHPALPTTNI